MDPETTGKSGEEFPKEEFDIDFEFDAPRFYDFSRPESDWEIEEAELWFEYSGNYPPSPFDLTFDWINELLQQFTSNNTDHNTSEIPNPTTRSLDNSVEREEKYSGYIYYNEIVNDIPRPKLKFKSKSTVSRKSSTLTKPTASLLARQNKPLDTYSAQLLKRCQRSLGKVNDKISCLLSSIVRNQDIKRRNLETGYPRKVVRVNSNSSRSKITVPREPNLQTAQRAGRHHPLRSTADSESSQKVKLFPNSSKRRSSNKNALEASSSISLPKRHTRRPSDLQESPRRLSLTATHRSSCAKYTSTADSTRDNDPMHSRTLKHSDSLKGIHITKTNSQARGSKICPIDPKLQTSNKEVGEAMANIPRFIQGVRGSHVRGLSR